PRLGDEMFTSKFRKSFLLVVAAACLVPAISPRSAAAGHITGLSGLVDTVDPSTRTVTVDVTETLTGTATHSTFIVDLGDGNSSSEFWPTTTTTTSGAIKRSLTGVSHIYPDVTARTITISDTGFVSTTSTFRSTTVDVSFPGCAAAPLGSCGTAAK